MLQQFCQTKNNAVILYKTVGNCKRNAAGRILAKRGGVSGEQVKSQGFIVFTGMDKFTAHIVAIDYSHLNLFFDD